MDPALAPKTCTRDWFFIEDEDDLPSPALLLFSDRIEENLSSMIEVAGGPGRLRPHVKTHKLGPLVERQLALGIRQFKAATVAEAAMCAAAGAEDILLAFPVVGPAARQLAELALQFPAAKFSTLVDDVTACSQLAGLAAEHGVTLGVWLDVDCGMHRTGIEPGPLALDLYRQLCSHAALEPRGLHAYDGHIHESDPEIRRRQCEDAFAPVVALRDELTSRGHPVPALAAGGSPTFPFHARHSDRECCPGTTVLWDFGYAERFPDLPFKPAAILLTRVISKPGAGRLCLDLGHKAVAAENPPPRVLIPELPDARFITHSEEHLVVESSLADQFPVGRALHAIPRHICPTVALYDEACVVHEGRVVDTWRITARGRNPAAQVPPSPARRSPSRLDTRA